eukprot:jgi/Phyca11/133012/e_gw1.294.1.1
MTRGEKRGLDDARNLYSKSRRDGADSASAQEDGCTDVLLFKEAWRALRGAGWTAKPPSRRSLDTRYKYVRPGGNPAGKENADYVLGEVAKQVALHARTMGLSSCGDGVGGDDVEVHGEHSGGTGSDRQTLSQLYSNTLVAFSPVREKWMAHKKYKQVGTTYIIGR